MDIKLQSAVTTSPDFDGFNFYVEQGRLFDADDYCEAYGLRRDELDDDSVKYARDAASRLSAGEWLHVSHELL